MSAIAASVIVGVGAVAGGVALVIVDPTTFNLHAGLGKLGQSGQTGKVIYDDLVDLVHSIDPAYRALNNCRWMMNDATIKEIRKLKDTVGRPIFTPGYESTLDTAAPFSMPDQLLGYAIQINQDVATMAANAKSVLFGDFSFYTIRDVMDVSMFRFTDSVYTKLGQVGFLAWMRAGGNFVDVGGSVKYYQNSAT
jgi:HK97 family phage major capsid protein